MTSDVYFSPKDHDVNAMPKLSLDESLDSMIKSDRNGKRAKRTFRRPDSGQRTGRRVISNSSRLNTQRRRGSVGRDDRRSSSGGQRRDRSIDDRRGKPVVGRDSRRRAGDDHSSRKGDSYTSKYKIDVDSSALKGLLLKAGCDSKQLNDCNITLYAVPKKN